MRSSFPQGNRMVGNPPGVIMNQGIIPPQMMQQQQPQQGPQQQQNSTGQYPGAYINNGPPQQQYNRMQQQQQQQQQPPHQQHHQQHHQPQHHQHQHQPHQQQQQSQNQNHGQPPQSQIQMFQNNGNANNFGYNMQPHIQPLGNGLYSSSGIQGMPNMPSSNSNIPGMYAGSSTNPDVVLSGTPAGVQASLHTSRGNLQQQQAQQQPQQALLSAQPTEDVRNVWHWNLLENMAILREIIKRYNFISLECKFPGIVARPIGTFKSTYEYHYQTLRANVDILQVVQVSMTFSDEFGNRPPVSTWQFNFKFNVCEDMSSIDGIELLRQSGVNFEMLEVEGIDIFAFAEMLISSGLVLNPDIHWITFHSGYDLGYLLSLMINTKLPAEKTEFIKYINMYFPSVWDVKYILRSLSISNKSTLLEIAEDIQLRLSQAGDNNGFAALTNLNHYNEALLTSIIFFETRKLINDLMALSNCRSRLFGLVHDPETPSSGTIETSS